MSVNRNDKNFVINYLRFLQPCKHSKNQKAFVSQLRANFAQMIRVKCHFQPCEHMRLRMHD